MPNSQQAKGRFDVKLAKLDVSSDTPETIGRRGLDKKFEGALAGTSRGEMLMTAGAVAGSAAYVAIERFDGTLAGRRGSFALAHHGVLDRGAPTQLITVVPDSGTDELSGLTGGMTIDILESGEHRYTFDYVLPPR